MSIRLRLPSLLLALAVSATAACGGGASTAPAPTPTSSPEPVADARSLFERLGGLPAIEAVVKEFVANVAADVRINTFFINTDVAHLEAMLTEQICQATGGPCTYSGKTMREVHTGMRITDADFTALVEDLVLALDKFAVPERERSELLTALGGMHGDIVGI